MDYVAGSLFISSQTLLNNLFCVPPGCVVRIDSNDQISIQSFTPLVLTKQIYNYESEGDWLEKYNELLTKLMRIQPNVLESAGLTVGALLSSGLDSSLLAYCMQRELGREVPCFFLHSDYAPKADDLQTAQLFANIHGLDLTTFDGSDNYPFSDAEDYLETQRYPANTNPLRSLVSKFHESIPKDINIVSSGEGGNELYRSTSLNFGRFYLQEQYFALISVMRSNMADFLTPKATQMLVSRSDFYGLQTYPSAFPPSAVLANWSDFANYWPLDLWAIHPFQNLPLLKFFNQSMINGHPLPERNKLLKNWLGAVFVDSQFDVTSNYDPIIARLFIEKVDFVVDLLDNSVLSKWGLVNVTSLLRRIMHGDISFYMKEGGVVQLQKLVQAEYFIQTNRLDPEDLSNGN